MSLQLLIQLQLNVRVLLDFHGHQLYCVRARRVLHILGSVNSTKTTRLQYFLDGVLAVDRLADFVMQIVQKLGFETFI